MEEDIFDHNGFLRESQSWTRSLAGDIADRENIGQLDDRHWQVIDYLRRHYASNKTLPVMKLLCSELQLRQGCVSELFGNPEKAWKVAGLPDYGEEFKAYVETAEQPEE